MGLREEKRLPEADPNQDEGLERRRGLPRLQQLPRSSAMSMSKVDPGKSCLREHSRVLPAALRSLAGIRFVRPRSGGGRGSHARLMVKTDSSRRWSVRLPRRISSEVEPSMTDEDTRCNNMSSRPM